jgi:hypothetical protein
MTEGYYRIHTLALGPVALFKTSTGHLERMDMKRIKHNDLLPWFLEDHDQLPDAYKKSCQKFFDELQATSHKRQATSLPQLESIHKTRKDNYENK